MGKLDGKVAIVTGASSGFGETTARALSNEGARVVLLARRKDRLDALSQEIASSGGRALAVSCDVADSKQAARAVEAAVDAFGRVDILINNAGVMLLAPVDRASVEEWQQMININVLGLMYCTRLVVPMMKKQKSGHIVNISSVAGRIARAGSSGYNASKWAVGAFSEALRQEVCTENIRVTIIEPGVAETELADHIPHEDIREQVKQRAQSMASLTSQDVADAIIWALTRPSHVNINEILMRPTEQLI